MKFLAPLLAMVVLQGCFIKNNSGSSAPSVNVYSSRHYDVDKTIIKNFEKETGIQVNIITDEAEKLLARLEHEGKNSACDVFIATDIANLYKANKKGLIQPLEMDDELVSIPENYKTNNWVALTLRARVIVFHKNFPADSVLRYEQLGNEFLRGKLLMRSSDNTYNRSLVASVLHYNGEEFTRQWVKNMVRNFAANPSGNDKDQVKAIAAGRGKVSVVNTYYVMQMATSADDAEKKAIKEVVFCFPYENERGTHINISGACIAKHAPNKENAKKFIAYLLNKKSQELYHTINREYPVLPGVRDTSKFGMNYFSKFDTLNLETLGSLNEKAMQIIAESGWK